MEEIINELEKKRTEIYTDAEDLDGSEDYVDGYIDAWVNAFEVAIDIVKEGEAYV